MRTWLRRWGAPAAVGLLLFVPAAPEAALWAREGPPADGEHLRTEDEDATEAPAEEASAQLGTLGAVRVPLAIPEPCQATLALYTPEGQLVRILGQVLDLDAGEYLLRWDGLDLFGNVVDAGTPLVLKVITNPGVQATYEFSVGAAVQPPWDGWLGDHSAPGSAAAVGDRVVLGCFVAEHGSNMVALDLDGHKIWRSKLAGWHGPRALASDGTDVFALRRGGKEVYRVNFSKGKHLKLYDAGRDEIRAMAARPGELILIARNHARDRTSFRRAVSNGTIDFARSRPQVLGTSAPTEFHISARAAFGNTFHSPGNPQNGARLIVWNDEAFLVLVFKEPVSFGTVVLEGDPAIAKAQVYALKAGLEYDTEKHSPIRDSGDAIMDSFNIAEFDPNWVLAAEGTLDERLNFLPAKDPDAQTRAVYLKLTPSAKNPPKDWRPGIAMCRLMKQRFTRVSAKSRLNLPRGAKVQSRSPAGRIAWDLRMEIPATEIYPAVVVADLGAEKTFDGLAILNCVNPDVYVDVFAGDASTDPHAAGEKAWREVARVRGKYNKKLRWLSASTKANEHYVDLPERTTARALRFRVVDGYRHGKWGRGRDDPFRVECGEVALLRLAGEPVQPPSHFVRVVASADGSVKRELAGDELAVDAASCAPDGTLFTVVGNRLCRTEIADSGLNHTVLSDGEIRDGLSLAASEDRLAVGDRARHAVLLFDHTGTLLKVLGERGPRVRGPWDPQVIDRPSAVAIDARGTIWVAEEKFAPKRVARFAADGTFLREWLGPPMYGGGGFLDPDLRRFYYRSMEFALDWEAGTSRLKNLNDTFRSPESPALDAGSFSYTGIGRPILYRGRRYIVGETVICMLDGSTWKPCVVMGQAGHSPFLFGKETWNRHWARFDLSQKSFIWCDANDDGAYQVEEVELFDTADLPDWRRGLAIGPDLSMWGRNYRIVPHGWTPGGVPLFAAEDFRPFDYDALAPHYPRNYTLGGPRSAKPGYGGFKWVLEDGSIIQEGQPYVVRPDLTIAGGPVTTKPTDYVPPIDGLVMNQPWKFTGGAMTESPLGEIACVNSNNGYWYVWAARYGCVVSTFFTGADGGWGWGMEAERGMDVTGRKQSWEAWGGHFVKADDGGYYAAAGKGFHGISRIHGLDDFRVREIPIEVTPESVAANTKLRALLKSRYEAMRLARSKSGRRTYAAAELRKRLPAGIKIDGDLSEWGKRSELQSIGPEKNRLFFDATFDERGVVLAWAGETHLGNAAEDWRKAFSDGFALDFQWRSDAKVRARDVAAGDRRIVVTKHGGEWIAILYDYVDPQAPDAGRIEFVSDVVSTRIARIARLGPEACRLAVKEDSLGISLDDLSGTDLEGFGEAPTLPGEVTKTDGPPKGSKRWSAEVFLPWETLGLTAEEPLRADFGVLVPDSEGRDVAWRSYWSNRSPDPLGDEAIEAALAPGAWGTVTFGRK